MVQISLNIDEKDKNYCKLHAFMYSGIWKRGMEVVQNANQNEKTILELTKRLEKVSTLLEHYARKSFFLEDRIKELEAKNVMEQKKNKHR
jgi:hypothetical protein